MTWSEEKLGLKRELCAYFKNHGADNKKLVEICALLKRGIKIEVEVATAFQSEYLSKEDSCLWGEINQEFSPQTRDKVWEFSCRLFQLELLAAKHLQKQRYWLSSDHCWARDDFEYEDYENQLPKGEIVIAPDAVFIELFEYWEGFKNQLPPNSKYLGNSKWRLELSQANNLKFDFPVLKYPDIK